MQKQSNITIFTDGGSRGNPGESAIGVVILGEEKVPIHSFGKRIGIATNNVAEYTAVIEAFSWIVANRELIGEIAGINSFLDSELVCSQITGVYKVKNTTLAVLLQQVKQKEKELGTPISYTHIFREYNKEADALVNKALDNRL